jgi:hypothetical protein
MLTLGISVTRVIWSAFGRLLYSLTKGDER